jgi:hypothetical protein
MSKAPLPVILMVLLFAARPVPAATGVFREQIIPGSPAGATEVVRGPDGGFWFTEFDGNRIGTISRDGVFREFTVPTPDPGLRGIATSNAIWFTESKAGKIGKLTPDGIFTEYAIPSPQSVPWGITNVEGNSVTAFASRSPRPELIDPDGHVIASRDESLSAGGSVYLVDVIVALGVAGFPDGQLRVRKSGDRGLLWGYLATVDVNGAISLFPGLNP